MASEFEFIITQAMVDEASRIVLEKYAPRIEDILRKHVEDKIENYTIPTATGGPWYQDGSHNSPYIKRHAISGAITHKIEGDTLLVSSTASSSPSVITHGFISGWGNYLEFFEVGNRGFKGSGFPRLAVTDAQKEADMLIPQMQEEAIKILESMIG